MKQIILDTQCWLWSLLEPSKLNTEAKKILRDTSNELFLSSASIWEITIKCALGKLTLPEDPSIYIPSRMQIQNISPLPIYPSHALQTYHLPHLHNDPFDRLLIAQSIVEQSPILTADKEFQRYGIDLIKAN